MRSLANRRIVSPGSLVTFRQTDRRLHRYRHTHDLPRAENEMTLLSIPMGPHDVPFAAQPMTAALLAFRRMHTFIKPETHSSSSNTPEGAE